MSDMHHDIAVATSDHCYEIRRLHRPFRHRIGGQECCLECDKVYPCPTIAILDRRLT